MLARAKLAVAIDLGTVRREAARSRAGVLLRGGLAAGRAGAAQADPAVAIVAGLASGAAERVAPGAREARVAIRRVARGTRGHPAHVKEGAAVARVAVAVHRARLPERRERGAARPGDAPERRRAAADVAVGGAGLAARLRDTVLADVLLGNAAGAGLQARHPARAGRARGARRARARAARLRAIPEALSRETQVARAFVRGNARREERRRPATAGLGARRAAGAPGQQADKQEQELRHREPTRA